MPSVGLSNSLEENTTARTATAFSASSSAGPPSTSQTRPLSPGQPPMLLWTVPTTSAISGAPVAPHRNTAATSCTGSRS